MSTASRRTFLKQSAAACAALAVPQFVPQAAFGANDTIRVAVAGIHGRGAAHIDAFTSLKGSTVSYLVDPDRSLFKGRAGTVEKKTGKAPTCVQDIRQALDDKNVDVVSIATTNHWHSLITIWACQAGKDVYVEKPCSHNVFEGRKCVEAARKYKRIVQHGTQKRASDKTAQMIAAVHGGQYGKLLVAKGYCCKPRWSIGFKETGAPPADLDFNLWLGPASEQPYHANLVHYNWHWFWDFGNGDMGNQGVHEMDVARWGIRGGTLPKSVVSVGGRWVEGDGNKDQGQTPNMLLDVFDFGGPLLVFETRGLVTRDKSGKGSKAFPAKVANEYYMEQGVIREGQFYAKGSTKGEPLPKGGSVQPGGPFGNFLDAVRSRNPEQLNAEILVGHYSAACCHLGNISYRLGKPAPLAQRGAGMGDAATVVESLKAIDENLEGALGLKAADLQFCLGPKLEFDPDKEKFVNNPAADALLTRNYRKPFVVPNEV